MNAQPPKTLNGYPVIAASPREGSPDSFTVIVYREGSALPFVVATWFAHLGPEWLWGHYCKTLIEACECYESKHSTEKEIANAGNLHPTA